jgi:hypothetical protein
MILESSAARGSLLRLNPRGRSTLIPRIKKDFALEVQVIVCRLMSLSRKKIDEDDVVQTTFILSFLEVCTIPEEGFDKIVDLLEKAVELQTFWLQRRNGELIEQMLNILDGLKAVIEMHRARHRQGHLRLVNS